VDRYFEDTLEMRWSDWMVQQIADADFVLVVATLGYRDRLNVGPGVPGAGGYFEGALITQYLYDSHGANAKFFAVHFGAEDEASIPLHLKGYTSYNIGTDDVDYLDWLAERLAPEKPFVGYHAALTLFTAARTFEQDYSEPVRTAIQKAQQLLGPGRPDPRQFLAKP